MTHLKDLANFFLEAEFIISIVIAVFMFWATVRDRKFKWLLYYYISIVLVETISRYVIKCNIPLFVLMAILETYFIIRFIHTMVNVKRTGVILGSAVLVMVAWIIFNQDKLVFQCYDNELLNRFFLLFSVEESRLVLTVRSIVLIGVCFVAIIQLLKKEYTPGDSDNTDLAYLFTIMFLASGSLFVTAFVSRVNDVDLFLILWEIIYLSIYIIYSLMLTAITAWKIHKLPR